MQTSETTKWYTPKEYASLIGKSKVWVYMMIRLGKVKSRKVEKIVIRLEVTPVDNILDNSK